MEVPLHYKKEMRTNHTLFVVGITLMGVSILTFTPLIFIIGLSLSFYSMINKKKIKKKIRQTKLQKEIISVKKK